MKAVSPTKGSKKPRADSLTSGDSKTDEKSENRTSHSLDSSKGAILQKLLDGSSFIDNELRNSRSTDDSSVTERIWITEANGDINQPIDDWRCYKDDQIVNVEFHNGNVYKGRVSRHVMHGDGEFIWTDGTSYKGTFHTGQITGSGVVVWSTQSWYKGELLRGYRHGSGLLVEPGRLAFTGNWHDGIRTGRGLLIYDSEEGMPDYLDASWNMGVCHGEGSRVYPSGATYHGQWKEGKRHGYGVIHWPNGDNYKGNWKNDRMHGLGQFTWSSEGASPHALPFSFRNRYYGTFVDGYRHENNPFSFIKDHRNPFERLSFFQFLHYLIEIAWQLYGRYGERHPKTPGALASALEKFIIGDMKRCMGNISGLALNDSRNLCFMREIFGLYQSFESDLTARKLLMTILNWEKNSHLKDIQEMSYDIIKQFDALDFNFNKSCDVEENLEKSKSEPAKIMCLAYLGNVNSRIAIKCILHICPKIKTSNRFYNMDYKITFLELYEILLSCAVECSESKKKKEHKKREIEMKLLQKSKEEKRPSVKKSRLSRDNSAKAPKTSKKT